MTTTDVQVWTPTEDDDGGGGLTASDLRIEFLQVNGQLGKFTFGRKRNEGPERVRNVVLYKLNDSRAYFKPGALADPLCSSDNGIVPIDANAAAKLGAGPACADCVFGRWGEKDNIEKVRLRLLAAGDLR